MVLDPQYHRHHIVHIALERAVLEQTPQSPERICSPRAAAANQGPNINLQEAVALQVQKQRRAGNGEDYSVFELVHVVARPGLSGPEGARLRPLHSALRVRKRCRCDGGDH